MIYRVGQFGRTKAVEQQLLKGFSENELKHISNYEQQLSESEWAATVCQGGS